VRLVGVTGMQRDLGHAPPEDRWATLSGGWRTRMGLIGLLVLIILIIVILRLL
jgi:hypothetical protein